MQENNDERFSYPEVVIGSCMDALTYAQKNGTPVIYAGFRVPSSADDAIMWSELCFQLSVLGRIPFGDTVEFIRIKPDLCFLEVVGGSKAFRVRYKKLTVFSDENLKGLPAPIETNDKFKVLDWMDVKEGMTHEHECLESDSNFVKYVRFHPTNRLDGVHLNKKDAVAISFLDSGELNDIGWSDNYARLKVVKMMEDAGITGNMIEQGRYRSIKVEHSFREVIPLGKNKYEKVPNVEFR